MAERLTPGTLFASRYEIAEPLGRGGMGTVYRARDRVLDESVAIKVLRPDFAEDPKMAQRFKAEIRLARKVRHKNVCAIHDFGEEGGLLYISMEYIAGVDLKTLLRQEGALPPQQSWEAVLQICDGLQAVHEAGIIHRDLKPLNVMRDAKGVFRLMDFGIAKELGVDGTTAGQILGTPEYMSPEQAQGRRLDFRSDVYALGILLFEVFTGRVPFKGDTPISTILKHINDPPPLEVPEVARLPPALRAVLRRALAKEPAGRYATVQEMAEALRKGRRSTARAGPPTIATIGMTLPAAEPPRRRRVVVAAVAGLGIAAAVTAILLLARGAALSPGERSASPAVTAEASLPPATEAPPSPLAPSAPAAVSGLARAKEPPAASSPAPRAVKPAALVAPATTLAAPAPSPAPDATAPPSAAAPPPPSGDASPASPVGRGMLQVGVKPWAEVFVDGGRVGTTPLNALELPVGAHTVVLVHPAYERMERTVAVRAGAISKLTVDLTAEGTRKKP